MPSRRAGRKSRLEYDPTDSDWGRWKVATFPPDVSRYFVMMSVYDATDAG